MNEKTNDEVENNNSMAQQENVDEKFRTKDQNKIFQENNDFSDEESSENK